MNQQQRNHAVNRIEQICRQHCRDQKARYTSPAVKLDSKQRADLLRQGKVPMYKDCDSIGRYTDVLQVFDFSSFEREEKIAPEYAIVEREINEEGARLVDQVMLGTGDEALAAIAAITEFSKKY